MHILVSTAHYDIQLNVTNSECLLNPAECLIPAKVFTWMRASNSRWSERKILLSLWVQFLAASGECPFIFCYITSTSSSPCILWISQLDYYFLCRLFTGYSKVKISGAMTFRTSLNVSWMDLFCEFYDGPQALEICALHLVVILMYKGGFEPPVTEG